MRLSLPFRPLRPLLPHRLYLSSIPLVLIVSFTWLPYFVGCTLRVLPTHEVIEGITIHLSYKFVKHRVQARGIRLDVNFEDVISIEKLIEEYKGKENLHCNLNKVKAGKAEETETEQVVEGNILRTENCVVFLNIRYKNNLKNVYSLMEYMYVNTSASALILICDNFLYDNEIYNPHDDLNFTVEGPCILTYLVPRDFMLKYEKQNYEMYTFELYWGIDNKTDIVHIIYHLDFGKYFNYTFFLYMKNFLLELKNYITYELQFSIHKNFTIDPRFCFIRDSSYCVSEPDYINSNVVREVVEQQVRSLCIYELTAVQNGEATKEDAPWEDAAKEGSANEMGTNEETANVEIPDNAGLYIKMGKQDEHNWPESIGIYNESYNEEKTPSWIVQKKKVKKKKKKKKRFSEKYIHYVNALFDFGFEQKFCSNGSNDLTKKCSDKILALLNIPLNDVNRCFLKNFHLYMKNMIKSKIYVYSIVINGKTYKMKLSKNITIKLICSAFKNMPPKCRNYLSEDVFSSIPEDRHSGREELIPFLFILVIVLAHIGIPLYRLSEKSKIVQGKKYTFGSSYI
ncbi:conserved Plasmodium protein, unknown function [Plasmodium ovale]|uniref:Uncharacterized protein n=1 Tax=Plasmodium ovale TaxID=36330 RepID=A0A1D3UAY6_PLAOA|nr:conserved Plasmodium protein, unknown function [Plasmodium ovale]